MSNPQQGWYPDPQDPTKVRWWDGAKWTEHTQPHPHHAAQQHQEAAAAASASATAPTVVTQEAAAESTPAAAVAEPAAATTTATQATPEVAVHTAEPTAAPAVAAAATTAEVATPTLAVSTPAESAAVHAAREQAEAAMRAAKEAEAAAAAQIRALQAAEEAQREAQRQAEVAAAAQREAQRARSLAEAEAEAAAARARVEELTRNRVTREEDLRRDALHAQQEADRQAETARQLAEQLKAAEEARAEQERQFAKLAHEKSMAEAKAQELAKKAEQAAAAVKSVDDDVRAVDEAAKAAAAAEQKVQELRHGASVAPSPTTSGVPAVAATTGGASAGATLPPVPGSENGAAGADSKKARKQQSDHQNAAPYPTLNVDVSTDPERPGAAGEVTPDTVVLPAALVAEAPSVANALVGSGAGLTGATMPAVVASPAPVPAVSAQPPVPSVRSKAPSPKWTPPTGPNPTAEEVAASMSSVTLPDVPGEQPDPTTPAASVPAPVSASRAATPASSPAVGNSVVASSANRFLAACVDTLIALMVTSMAVLPQFQDFKVQWDLLNANGVPDLGAWFTQEAVSNFVIAFLLVFTVFPALYNVLMVKYFAGTVGHFIFGLKVVDARTKQLPSWGAALLRWLLKLPLSQAIGPFGLVNYAYCVFDKRGQCLHDKAARTIVVKPVADEPKPTA